MEQDPVVLYTNHVRLKNAVVPGGILMETDIFLHKPVELENIHPNLWFVTPVHEKKRRAINGQWKRICGKNRPFVNNNGVKIGIEMRYQFKWDRIIEARPNYSMTEYVKSMHGRTGICIIRREPEPNVEEVQEEEEQQQGQ